MDFEAFYDQRRGARSAIEDAILVAAIDGKGIPMVKAEPAELPVRLGKGQKRQKKRMSTVAAVFYHHPRPRTPEEVVESLFAPAQPADRSRLRRDRSRPRDKRVWASLLADKTAFITGVRDELQHRDPDHERPWVTVTDGERALQKRVCTLFADVPLVLDLFHVLDKLWKAAHALHPEGSPEAQCFVRDRTLRILRGQGGQVVKGLRQMVTKRRLRGTKRKTLSDVAGYLHRNRGRMHYDVYLAKG